MASAVLDSGMRLIPLLIGAALFCAPAKADKFWLSDPQAEKDNAAAGSSPNLIEGVLIAESDEGYHVRIVGGEVLLPKASVYKIEKDDLTLDAIVDAEKDAKAAGERADVERRLAQEAASVERERQAAEASMRPEARAVDAAASARPTPVAPAFDAVLGVAPVVIDQLQLMRAARAQWNLTRDRQYLKQLRRLRRMR